MSAGDIVASPWLTAMTAGQPRIFDLGQPLHMHMPQWPAHPPYIFSLMRRHGDTVHRDGTTGANELLVMCGHTGTHIDGLGHVCQNGLAYGGVTADEMQAGGIGMRSVGIETVTPLVRRGCLLDIARLRDREELEPEYEVTPRDLEAACHRQDVSVQEGDAVLLRTGWGRLWGEPSRYIRAGRGLPGPNAAAARWLADRRIALTGSDTAVYEFFPPNPDAMPAHSVLLVENGIFIMENLFLEDLASASAWTFVFVVLPLKIVGGTGSPIRPAAIV
jgi:kynurenine formamidase